MKKLIIIILSLTFVLALAGCNGKKNIPTLVEVSQMKYTEVNEVLSGCTIGEIRAAWGEPFDSDENGDSWRVDNSMIITVKYDENTNSGIVESCELVCGTPLAPAESTASELNDELPEKEAFVVTNIYTNETKPLIAEDGLTLSDILERDSWNTEGTADCASNIEIIINGATYRYHSDCGTFNDNVNQRSLSLDEEMKETVNSIMAEYISLVSTDVPVE